MNWNENDLFGLNGKNWKLLQHSYLFMPQCDYNNMLYNRLRCYCCLLLPLYNWEFELNLLNNFT